MSGTSEYGQIISQFYKSADSSDAKLKDKSFLAAVLNRNGVSLSPDKSSLVVDKSKLPSLVWLKPYKNGRPQFDVDEYTLRLYYYDANPETAQSHFDFDLDTFVNSYQGAKYKNLADPDEYISFSDSFFSEYPEQNCSVKAIFDLYALNPTKLSKCLKKRKTPLRRLKIGAKIGKAEKVFNLNILKTRKSSNRGKDILYPPPSHPAYDNMLNAVKNAAIEHNLQYFEAFKSAFASFYHKPLTLPKIDKLWKNFTKAVDNYQNTK